MDLKEIEPEITGRLGIAGLAPVGLLIIGALLFLDLLDGVVFGIALFVVGVAVFGGSVWVSRQLTIKKAQNLAIAGLSLLTCEILYSIFIIRSAFH